MASSILVLVAMALIHRGLSPSWILKSSTKLLIITILPNSFIPYTANIVVRKYVAGCRLPRSVTSCKGPIFNVTAQKVQHFLAMAVYGQNPISNEAVCTQQSASVTDIRQHVFCQTANLVVMDNQHN
jgi:hypothetical protein